MFQVAPPVFIKMWTIWGDDGYLYAFPMENDCVEYLDKIHGGENNTILENSCLSILYTKCLNGGGARFLWQHPRCRQSPRYRVSHGW
jgi:hypothetical protein